MTDSGDTSPLPVPPLRPTATPVHQGPTHRQPGSTDAAWLTESAYARPITDASGQFRRPARPRWRRLLRTLFFLIVLAIPLSVLVVGGAVYWQARSALPHEADAIVVMGAAQYNGRPSAVFQARLDHAYNLYQQGYAPLVVLTGGKMPGDAYTEAESGRQYLIERGMPASDILYENEGRDTWQSMRGVSDLLEGSNVESLLIVTDGFHLLRSEMMARNLGFTAYGSSAPNSPIQTWSGTEFSYVIRETGGIFAFAPTALGFG